MFSVVESAQCLKVAYLLKERISDSYASALRGPIYVGPDLRRLWVTWHESVLGYYPQISYCFCFDFTLRVNITRVSDRLYLYG